MAVYAIAEIEVLDQTLFDEYLRKVPATVAVYGGRHLARGGPIEILDGSRSPSDQVELGSYGGS
jgi:uncharacterized protein (DUF1330 family)